MEGGGWEEKAVSIGERLFGLKQPTNDDTNVILKTILALRALMCPNVCCWTQA